MEIVKRSKGRNIDTYRVLDANKMLNDVALANRAEGNVVSQYDTNGHSYVKVFFPTVYPGQEAYDLYWTRIEEPAG